MERRPDIKQAKAFYVAQNAQIVISETMRWPYLNNTATLDCVWFKHFWKNNK
ncbi:MAG: hypothetical protein KAH68_07580 [Draconibacterium sp.]|nr:hypothetical protein [Draconibacterium sp.]